MKELEDYFIDEEKIKQLIACDHPVKNQDTFVSDTQPDATEHSGNEGRTSSCPAEIKADSEPPLFCENVTKPPLHSFFDGYPTNVRSRSRISIPSDITFRLKRVALYMEQSGKPHSVNTYINNILLRHLDEYDNEISSLLGISPSSK